MGVGWTVELKLNRKKEKIGFQRGGGGCDPPTPPPPLDPPLTRHLYLALSLTFKDSASPFPHTLHRIASTLFIKSGIPFPSLEFMEARNPLNRNLFIMNKFINVSSCLIYSHSTPWVSR